jgi:hypothetical protein
LVIAAWDSLVQSNMFKLWGVAPTVDGDIHVALAANANVVIQPVIWNMSATIERTETKTRTCC